MPVHKTHYQAIKLACVDVEQIGTHIHGVKARETNDNGSKRRFSIDLNIPREKIYLRSLNEV